jgi:hypothetical protein
VLPELYHYPADESFVPAQEMLDKTTQRCLRVLEDAYAQVEHQATHKFRGRATGFSNRLSSLLTLDDYNPPNFQGSREGIESLTEEVDQLEYLGLEAEDSAKAALGCLLPLLERSSFQDGIQVAHTINDWNQSASSFTEDLPTTTFEYLQPLFPNFLDSGSVDIYSLVDSLKCLDRRGISAGVTSMSVGSKVLKRRYS